MTDIGRREQTREPISIWGSYRNGRGKARDVHFLDMNLRGCRFYDKFCGLRVSENLLLKLHTFGPIVGIVRWVAKSHVGVEFRDPLHIAIFDHLKASQEETAQRALGKNLSNW